MFPNSYFPKSYFVDSYWARITAIVTHYIYAAASVFSMSAVEATFRVSAEPIVCCTRGRVMVTSATGAVTSFIKTAVNAVFNLIGKSGE